MYNFIKVIYKFMYNFIKLYINIYRSIDL